MSKSSAWLIDKFKAVVEFVLHARRSLFTAAIGALAIDLSICFIFGWFGMRPELAQFVSGILAAIFFVRFDPLIGDWLKGIVIPCSVLQHGVRVAGLSAVAISAVSFRSALFNLLLNFNLPLAIVAILLSGLTFIVLAWLRQTFLNSEVSVSVIAWCCISAMFVLRILYIGLPELIPEEAYYWLYSQHLAPGYLDHPPMVGWLIAAGTSLFGDSQFGVRFPALVCWIIGGWFLFQIAKEQFDHQTGVLSLALYSIAPFFFGIGLTIAPDSPLIAAWLAALYFLRLALVNDNSKAWYGFGVAIGLGMLSKYTIVLLAPSVALFLILHPPARIWLRRPQPYLAALLAFLIFTPVLYWNATHDWASFVFQGPRRMEMPTKFALHQLFFDIIVLITPSAVVAAVALLLAPRKIPSAAVERRFVFACAVVPVIVFAIYSLRHETKLNWTGPAFSGLLPCISAYILSTTSSQVYGWRLVLLRSWIPTALILTVIYSSLLHAISFGWPVIGYPPKTQRFIGWHNLAQQVSDRAQQLAQSTGSDPWIIGMDKHYIASELSFYMGNATTRFPVTSRQIFGIEALMFRFWSPTSTAIAGRNMILVSRNTSDLRDELIQPYFKQLQAIEEIKTFRDGEEVGRYYLRVGLEFSPTTPSDS